MALTSRWVQLHLLGGTTRCSVPSTWSDPSHLSVNRFHLQRPTHRHRQFCSVPTDQSHHLQNAKALGSGGSIVGDLLDYLNESWTQFHATAEAKRQLIESGFRLLREDEEWDLKPGGKYFFTRNMSSLVAFAIGEKYNIGSGFHAIAAHTDSPCLKLKPKSASEKAGYLLVNVQTYGGGLWHTWFDRDLSVAGRVILRRHDGSFMHKLVKIKRPLLRIPTLAIHLDRSVNTDGFRPNLETHLVPFLARKMDVTSGTFDEKNSASKTSHHPLLLQVLSEELDCSVDDIVSLELNVCDTQPSCLGGGNDEFIFSGRLDNLASCFCALKALINSCNSSEDLANESAIRMVALFDNEEVGSDTAQGAGAPTMFQAMRRIVDCVIDGYTSENTFERAIRQSFLVSADMAHGVHPNFIDKHEEHHRPELQKGLVIKHNANQRYATNAVTAFLFKEIANVNGLPTQEFVVRNDMGCGSTIGPILASGVGIRTVDCGIAQLSMHSPTVPSPPTTHVAAAQPPLFRWSAYLGFELDFATRGDKYRVLSHITRDILAIPATSVALESTFSTGGKVLDTYMSCLNPKTVDALVCTGDRIRYEKQESGEIDDEEDEENEEDEDRSDTSTLVFILYVFDL